MVDTCMGNFWTKLKNKLSPVACFNNNLILTNVINIKGGKFCIGHNMFNRFELGARLWNGDGKYLAFDSSLLASFLHYLKLEHGKISSFNFIDTQYNLLVTPVGSNHVRITIDGENVVFQAVALKRLANCHELIEKILPKIISAQPQCELTFFELMSDFVNERSNMVQRGDSNKLKFFFSNVLERYGCTYNRDFLFDLAVNFERFFLYCVPIFEHVSLLLDVQNCFKTISIDSGPTHGLNIGESGLVLADGSDKYIECTHCGLRLTQLSDGNMVRYKHSVYSADCPYAF